MILSCRGRSASSGRRPGLVRAAPTRARLTTAAGPTVKVRVIGRTIYLQDKDPNARNPRVIAVDVNKGNRQIADAIGRVLRPLDLPPLAKKH